MITCEMAVEASMRFFDIRNAQALLDYEDALRRFGGSIQEIERELARVRADTAKERARWEIEVRKSTQEAEKFFRRGGRS